ncbi:MAG: S4 domain-containing protein, partial [bacterium]
MRLDLFLKLTGFAKTRMTAKRLCESRRVLLFGETVKPSRELVGGEELHFFFPQKEVKAKVLAIPPGKSVSKKERPLYVSMENLDVAPQETGGDPDGFFL